MKSNQNVIYIKLEPYLSLYWTKVMRLKTGEPLILPSRESDLFFIPFLIRNPKLKRSQSKNKKGHLKDTTSYCEYAYDFAMSEPQPPLVFDNQKIPTKHECTKLAPFLVPNRVIKRDGSEFATDRFTEITQVGAKYVRDYIRMDFYSSLYNRISDLRNRNRSITSIIEEFVLDSCIFSDDPVSFKSTCSSVRNNINTYCNRGFFDSEPETDSIRRKMLKYMDDRKLRPTFTNKY